MPGRRPDRGADATRGIAADFLLDVSFHYRNHYIIQPFSLGAESANQKEELTPMESMEEMENRHEKETKELEEKVKSMLKGLKKSAKATAEAQAIQMGFDLKAKHITETDELEEYLAKHGEVVSSPNQKEFPPAELISPSTMEQDKVQSKKEKAQRKKDRKAEKEVERLNVKESIKASSGPSLREVELISINKILQPENLMVKDIPSDGHCLFRSVADQLVFSRLQEGIEASEEEKALNFVKLRHLTAAYMRSHPEDFAPFLGLEADSSEFAEYCRTVESEEKAEWGGQLEIRAMSAELRRRIFVYDAEAPLLRMGEDLPEARARPPLRLSYHRHYFALGEHYNSICALAKSASLGEAEEV